MSKLYTVEFGILGLLFLVVVCIALNHWRRLTRPIRQQRRDDRRLARLRRHDRLFEAPTEQDQHHTDVLSKLQLGTPRPLPTEPAFVDRQSFRTEPGFREAP